MQITIKRPVAEEIPQTDRRLHKYLSPMKDWGYREEQSIDLTQLTEKERTALRACFVEHAHVRGTKVLVRDLDQWDRARTGSGETKARSVAQFETFLTQYIATGPHRWVFQRMDDGLWMPAYVNDIAYHYPTDRNEAPWVSMALRWYEFGKLRGGRTRFSSGSIFGLTTAEALAKKGFTIETPELVAEYLEDVEKFNALSAQIGLQCWAEGQASDDCDGNPSGRENSWFWRSEHIFDMAPGESRSRVCIDVFKEEAEEKERYGHHDPDIDRWFWQGVQVRGRAPLRAKKRHRRRAEDGDDDGLDASDLVEDFDAAEPEIPLRTYCAVFDFARHLRLRIFVRHLTPYVYDTTLVDKLILPPALKALVGMLVEHQTDAFTDLVRGKGGGAVVLLAGPPGVGKTLTAEVYAESEERCLYSVQCSQLGTDPDALEDELLKVFARAHRWNAVLLLDEADVYVHERGRDLDQNAIVGVFLRVLEYQSNVLFLTTNRPQDVDDAICSRCIARLPYPRPTLAEQKQIWRVLADMSQIPLSDRELNAITRAHADLTGRDIKNLLKLANLMQQGEPITEAAVTFARQFQPTGMVVDELKDPPKGLLQKLFANIAKLKARAKEDRETADGGLRTKLRRRRKARA